MNKKGMSQTLALIVAASVLMMTALTVIFMATQGLGGANDDKNVASCQGAIDSKCQINPDAENAPQVCLDSEGQPKPGMENIPELGSSGSLNCNR